MGKSQQQKCTQYAPFTKMECDYLNGWIKKRPYMQIIASNPEEEEKVSKETTKHV